MKKTFFAKISFLFLALVMGISSCEKDYYKVKANNSFKRFYSSRDNFEKGLSPITQDASAIFPGEPNGHIKESISIPQGDHLIKLPSIYYDGRDSLGNSTWSDPIVTYDGKSATISDSEGFLAYYVSITVVKALNTPPAHLHLCLRRWDEENAMQVGPLAWKVKSIVDDNGKDLTKDPEWIYYTDNMMMFVKADRFYFYPGNLRSAKESELFGTVSENFMIYGSYKVVKTITGEVQLTMVFPNFNTTLTVVESRFGYIKLSGISDGKKGILELTPSL